MKPPFVFVAFASVVLLLGVPHVQAAPATKASGTSKVAEMVRDPEMARAALHEMMKSAETKRMMARELARDREFRRLYASEIGTGAPHQERNPSDHPELFQRKKPDVR